MSQMSPITRVKNIGSWVRERAMVVFGTFAIMAFLTSITALMIFIRDQAEDSRAATAQSQSTTNSAYDGCVANNEFKSTIIDLFNSSRDLQEFVVNVAYIRPGLTPSQLALVDEQIARFQPGFDAFSKKVMEITLSDCKGRYPTADHD